MIIDQVMERLEAIRDTHDPQNTVSLEHRLTEVIHHQPFPDITVALTAAIVRFIISTSDSHQDLVVTQSVVFSMIQSGLQSHVGKGTTH